jgi:ribonuclease E
MLINVVEPEEARIAVLEDDSLEELYVERASSSTLLGNIYKGRVVSIEPSIQAAFVDFGIDKNGFLHVSDVMTAYARANEPAGGSKGGSGGGEEGAGNGNGNGGRGGDRGDREERGERKDIQSLLRKGQEVLVQVSKEEIGTKVPTLTTYISLPGRFLVLMPSISKRGVSKKIGDDSERRSLRDLLNKLNPPKGMGYIVRTAGAEQPANELVRDLNYLLKLWKAISKRVREVESPAVIYEESDLVLRTLRDLFTGDVDELVFDEPAVCERAKRFLGEVMPKFAERVKLYSEAEPLFHKFKVEEQIERLYDRKVSLPTGGSIIIDQTEALVAIDVNSGKYKDHDNLEETALRTNLEAAREACRQLKLRDIGGIVCIDFIDMKSEKSRQQVERAVREHLRRDRARTRVARMSKFCILELTRQRVRMSIRKTHYEPCPVCKGSGSVKTIESMGLSLVRQLRARAARRPGEKIEVHVNPDVALYLQQRKKDVLRSLEERIGKPVLVKPEKGLHVEQAKFSAL